MHGHGSYAAPMFMLMYILLIKLRLVFKMNLFFHGENLILSVYILGLIT